MDTLTSWGASLPNFSFWTVLVLGIFLIGVSIAFFAVLNRKVKVSQGGAAPIAPAAAQPAAGAAPAPAPVAGRAWNQMPWKTIGIVVAAAIIAGAAFWLLGGSDGASRPEVNNWFIFALLGAAALLVVAVNKPDKLGSILVWLLFIGLIIWVLFGYWKIQEVRVGSPNGARTTMEVVRPYGDSPDREVERLAVEQSRHERIAEIEAKRFDATLEPGERQVRIPIQPDGYVLKYTLPIGVDAVALCWTGSQDPPDDATFAPCGPNAIATWQVLELTEPQSEPVRIRWRFEKAV